MDINASKYALADTEYTVIRQTCLTGIYTYGIAAMASGILVDAVADYDTDENFVCKVAARLNDGKAQLCHFKEILEDELVAKTC